MDLVFDFVKNNSGQILVFLSTMITICAGAITTVLTIRRRTRLTVAKEQLTNLFTPLYVLFMKEINTILCSNEKITITSTQKKEAASILKEYAYLATDEILSSLLSKNEIPLGARELCVVINKEFNRCRLKTCQKVQSSFFLLS